MPLKKKKAARKKAATKKRVVKRKVVRKKVVRKKVVRKRAVKKPRKKALVKKVKKPANVIGKITHYFPKVQAAVIKLDAPLAVGDTIRIKGHTTDFKQAITSMQIDHVPITVAKKGDEVGLLVTSRVRQHDTVSKP
jgi:putative protease